MASTKTLVTALIALVVSAVTSAITGLATPFGPIAALVVAAAAFAVLWRIWPWEANPDWTLDEVVNYALGQDELKPVTFEDGAKRLNGAHALFSSIVQEAALGRLTIFGSRPTIRAFLMTNPTSAVAEIPAAYWQQHEIHLESFFKDDDGVTAVTHHEPDDNSYYSLKFDRRQITRFTKKWIASVSR